MSIETYIKERAEEAVKELGKQSTAPDRETPNWMEADIKRGYRAGASAMIPIMDGFDRWKWDNGYIQSEPDKYYRESELEAKWYTFKQLLELYLQNLIDEKA